MKGDQSSDSCWLCGGSVHDLVVRTSAWDIRRCVSCGLRTKVGGPAIRYEDLAEEEYAVFDYDRSKEVDDLIDCVERVVPFVEGMEILEIGCGTGALLHEFQTRGARVSGFEPSTAAVARARSLYGITTVTNAPFLASTGRVPARIILLNDVIEHLEDCHALFSSIRAAMADEAVLLVKTGDCAALNASLYPGRWAYYLLEQHVTFYSERALRALCDRTGFRVAAFRRNVHAFGGSAVWDVSKNLAKAALLRLSSEEAARHRRLQINLAYDHFIAVLAPGRG